MKKEQMIKDNQPLISIIIPIYRVEKYLDPCIKSIVNQTYRNIEIILVDDGSPDNCPAMCDDWARKDSRISVIHKENGGLSDARNKGMEICSGEYISHVDSDDVVDPKYIEYLYKTLMETEADFSMCRFSNFIEEPYTVDNSNFSSITILSQDELLYRFCNGTQSHFHNVWNKLYKRELVENILFAEGYQAQDLYFSCQVFCKAKKAAYINNILYHYRTRPDNASNAYFKQRADAHEMLYRCLQDVVQQHPKYAKDLKLYFYSYVIGTIDMMLLNPPSDNWSQLLKITNSYRKKIHLTKSEWRQSTFRQKIRCICSLPIINIIAIKIRQRLRNK